MPDRNCGEQVCLYLPHDTEAWQERHVLGEVPSRWPYGLDQIQVEGASLESSVITEGPVRLVARRIRPSRTISSTERAVTWDEFTASKVYIATGQRPAASGVIWLTDWLLRGSRSAKVPLVRNVLNGVGQLWTLGSAQTALLQECLGRTSGISTLAFGVDPDFFGYSDLADSRTVFSAGNDPDRDIEGTLDIARRVRSARPEANFVIQTPAPLESEDGITIVPRMTHLQIRDMYRNSAVVLVNTRPNTHVSGMTVALEALASGRPIVISDTLGMEEYVRDESLRIKVGDVEAAADRIISLIDDQSESKRIGVWGRFEISSHFNSARMASDLSRIIDVPVRRLGASHVGSTNCGTKGDLAQ